MIREKLPKNVPIVIDITGPEGNAFALMGYARRFASQLGLDSDRIIGQMVSGNYENLLQVFDENFGEYVILER